MRRLPETKTVACGFCGGAGNALLRIGQKRHSKLFKNRVRIFTYNEYRYVLSNGTADEALILGE